MYISQEYSFKTYADAIPKHGYMLSTRLFVPGKEGGKASIRVWMTRWDDEVDFIESIDSNLSFLFCFLLDRL